ncbi:MAG TPA: TPM domain-containing protein [Casimicrobiaceae bacterium]|nr:TPM domain-containing protein [Casimicrobiaceae bacterium]
MIVARTAWRSLRLPDVLRVGVAAMALVAALAATGAVPWDPPRDELQSVPPLKARVTDLTSTLSESERQALEAKLVDWEARTTNQLAVLIVPTTKPEQIEQYAIRVAEAWKIGQKGKDNGAILLVAKDDKQMRLEVGYGFEGVLTDLTSRRIISETIAPLFSKGQFAAGINAGIDRIIGVVGEGKPLPEAKPQRRAPSHDFDIGTLALILLVAVPAIGAILRRILGNVGGSVVGAGIVGGAAWLFAGSLLIAAIAAIVALVVISFSGLGGRGGPGLWIPGSGGGFGGGGFGGGGGFSGGGGGFGGGGASGGWN